MADARRDIQQVFLELEKQHPDWGLEFETYVSVPGARISEEHEMIRAIDRNHEAHHRQYAARGKSSPGAPTRVCSAVTELRP